MNPDQNKLTDASDSEGTAHPFAEEIDERLRSVKNPSERRTIAGLLREISLLPLDHTRAALETSAAIAAADRLGVGHGHGPIHHFHKFY